MGNERNLRGKNKEARLARILEAATLLFSERGFEGVSMEDIAQGAALAVGTLYNYFPSKSELLLGIISRRSHPFVKALSGIGEAAVKSPSRALAKAVECYLGSFSLFPKLLWRAFAATTLAKGLPLLAMIAEVDEPFIAALAAVARARDETAKVAAIKGLAAAAYGSTVHAIMEYVADDAIDEKELKSRILSRVTAVLLR